MLGYTVRQEAGRRFNTLIDIYGTSPHSKYALGQEMFEKENAIKDYRYHVTVEQMYNISASEKLNDAITCGSVPIYWGDNDSPALKYYNKDGIILFKTRNQTSADTSK